MLKNLQRKLRNVISGEKGNFNADGMIYGYENQILIETILNKTLDRKSQLTSDSELNLSEARVLPGFSIIAALDPVKILDFGGGGGTHYDVFKQIYPNKEVDYAVVETEQMIKLATRLRISEKQLHFISNHEMDSYDKPNLIISNSSLQYTDNPIKQISQLLGLNPEYVYITRTPLSEEFSEIEIHQESKLEDNGPSSRLKIQNINVTYTATIVPRSEFENAILKKSHIIAKVKEEINPFGSKYQMVNSWGYLLKSREN